MQYQCLTACWPSECTWCLSWAPSWKSEVPHRTFPGGLSKGCKPSGDSLSLQNHSQFPLSLVESKSQVQPQCRRKRKRIYSLTRWATYHVAKFVPIIHYKPQFSNISLELCCVSLGLCSGLCSASFLLQKCLRRWISSSMQSVLCWVLAEGKKTLKCPANPHLLLFVISHCPVCNQVFTTDLKGLREESSLWV